MNPPPFKTQFNHSPASERDLKCELPSLTKQEFKDESDINILCSRYREKGYFYNPLLPIKGERRTPQFGDFSALPDIHQAMETVNRATELFMALPAEVREACNHDPAAFLALEKNPEMQELLKKYGLVPAKSGVQGKNSPVTASKVVPPSNPQQVAVPEPNPAS